MHWLVRIADDLDDIAGLLVQALTPSGILAVCACVMLVLSGALVAGVRGAVIALIASAIPAALIPLGGRRDSRK